MNGDHFYITLLVAFALGLLFYVVYINSIKPRMVLATLDLLPFDGVANTTEEIVCASKGDVLIERKATDEVKPRFTDEEVDERIKESFEILDIVARQAINGDIRSLIISGPPGLGKSYTIDQALLEWDKDETKHTVIKGYVRPTGLYRMLYERRHEGNVLVFDDADSVFADETSLNLLKAVLDSSSKKRRVSYMSERKMKDERTGDNIPKFFDFEGSILFISNLDFDAMIAKEHRLCEHFKALLSRSHYIDMDMTTRQDYIVRIKQVIRAGMLKNEGLNAKEIADVIGFIEKNTKRLRELSLRVAIKIGEIRKSGTPNWEKIARATTCKKR